MVNNEEPKEKLTYQIIVTKELSASTNTEIEEGLNAAIKKANKIRAILFGVIAFIIICIFIFIIVRHKYNKAVIDDDAYDYDSEDKERLNLDDEEELFSRINKEKFEETVKDEKVTKVKKELDKSEKHNIKEEKDEPEEREDFFRTTRPKSKGKHF